MDFFGGRAKFHLSRKTSLRLAGLWVLEPQMDTDRHRWIWLDDPLAGVYVSGDALAAGCVLKGALLRLGWEPRKDTEGFVVGEGEVPPEPQTWLRLLGFGL